MLKEINGITITEAVLLNYFIRVQDDQYISQIGDVKVFWKYFDQTDGTAEEIGDRYTEYDFIAWKADISGKSINGSCAVHSRNSLPDNFTRACCFYLWDNSVNVPQINQALDSLEYAAKRFDQSEDRFIRGTVSGIRQVIALIRAMLS